MMKSTLKIIGALVTIALALSFSFANYPVSEVKQEEHETLLMPVFDLNNVGRNVMLSEVQSTLKLSQPTFLPSGTSLPQVKLRDNNALAALIFTNSHLDKIIGYEQDVQIVILAERDGTSFETVKLTSAQPTVTVIKDGKETIVDVPVHRIGVNRSTLVSINGHPGYGYEPMYTPIQDCGKVQWWSKDGIHYQILANLPLQDLVKIAESM